MAQVDYTRIASNIAALNSLNSLRNINTKLGISQMRLATGKRINEAAEDAAGLTIALKLNARNEGLKMAISNIGDAKNMLAVAESGLQQINSILTEMKTKATAAASDTLGSSEREAIQSQLQSLARQINDIVEETQWNGSRLLDGTVSKSLQTGAGAKDTTLWVLDQSHLASALNVATDSTSGASVSVTGNVTGSFATSTTYNQAGVELSAVFDGLSGLSNGEYRLKILDTAATSTIGKVASYTGVAGLTTITAAAAASASEELASGFYTLTIDNVATGKQTIDYTITDKFGNVVATYDGLNTSSATMLRDELGNDLGVKMSTNSSLNAGDQIKFEYIARNRVKMQLYQVRGNSEELVAVDENGIDDAGVDARASIFYMKAGSGASTGYDTGIGFKVHLKNLSGGAASIVTGSSTFRYETAVRDVEVDVSTASLASAYMDHVDAAITKVTNSLNAIGSLVARLSAKEEAVGIAQVNTEAAYNRIMNADMAYEQVQTSKYMILQQTAIAMLAQANAGPQAILSLFR